MPNDMLDLKQAVARFGAEAKAKLANPSATGESEDQLRAPLEGLFGDLAELCGFKREWVTAVGESSLSTLKTRPDYAITLRNVLVGFVGTVTHPSIIWTVEKPAIRTARSVADFFASQGVTSWLTAAR